MNIQAISLRLRKRKNNILPGFGLTLGFTVTFICLMLIIPLVALILTAGKLSFTEFMEIVTAPRSIASYSLSFGTSFVAALVNTLFGFISAWVLVRYEFPGKKVIDALVDLPFALPTAVAGISLTTMLAEKGILGKYLSLLGIKAVYNPIGIIIAMVFVGIPFVIRIVQPVIEDLDKELEEAAISLDATRIQIFRKVIFPEVRSALLTGFTLAFARALGEYGSVIFISGNMPFKTEIAPLLIVTKLEQYDYKGATAIALVMLTISFMILLLINIIQSADKKGKG